MSEDKPRNAGGYIVDEERYALKQEDGTLRWIPWHHPNYNGIGMGNIKYPLCCLDHKVTAGQACSDVTCRDCLINKAFNKTEQIANIVAQEYLDRIAGRA